jgi:hypothetical protein
MVQNGSKFHSYQWRNLKKSISHLPTIRPNNIGCSKGLPRAALTGPAGRKMKVTRPKAKERPWRTSQGMRRYRFSNITADLKERKIFFLTF